MSHPGKREVQVFRHFISVAMAMAIAIAFTGLSLPAFAQNVTVRVTILEVKALTNFDGLVDEADWFATVTIAGDEMDNEDEADEDEGNDHLFPNWEFTKSVPLSAGSVDINIEIRDEDDFLKLSDDLADINPFEGRASIDLVVDLEPCYFVGPQLLVVQEVPEMVEAQTVQGVSGEFHNLQQP